MSIPRKEAASRRARAALVGPIAYGFGLSHSGKMPTLGASAVVMVVLGLVCARLLKPRAPADAGA